MFDVIDVDVLCDGVLRAIRDARMRLLTPAAQIIPRGGSIRLIAAELRAPVGETGVSLDELLCELR